MSDNKLLNENTIRRFMKLANTEALSETFLEGVGRAIKPKPEDSKDQRTAKPAKPAQPEKQEESYKDKKDPPLREEEDLDNLEEQEEVEAEDDMGDDMEMDMEMDMDADIDAEPEVGAADMSLTEEEAEILIALGERLQAAMGEEDMDDMDDDMGAMDDMDDMDDMGGMDPEAGEEAPAKYDMMENEDDLVQEVLKRVTRRLIEAKINSRK